MGGKVDHLLLYLPINWCDSNMTTHGHQVTALLHDLFLKYTNFHCFVCFPIDCRRICKFSIKQVTKVVQNRGSDVS